MPSSGVHAANKSLHALASETVNVAEGKEKWDLKRYAVLASICKLPQTSLRIHLHEFMDEMLRNFQQKTNASWLLYIPGMLHALGATEAEIEAVCPYARMGGKSKAVDLKKVALLPAKGIQGYFKEHYESMDTHKKQLIMAARVAKAAKLGRAAKTAKFAKSAKSAEIAKAAKELRSGTSAGKGKKMKAVIKK